MISKKRRVLDRRNEDKDDFPCSFCLKCANQGFGCFDYITKAEERNEIAFYGQLTRPDCYKGETA